mmetsp:Transcript_145916/g.467729  ORF Transcript_145916/g.467729 Transcript_145916/m.467729 type:complete len:217 (-) Transcript_145916:904-1554(-)
MAPFAAVARTTWNLGNSTSRGASRVAHLMSQTTIAAWAPSAPRDSRYSSWMPRRRRPASRCTRTSRSQSPSKPPTPPLLRCAAWPPKLRGSLAGSRWLVATTPTRQMSLGSSASRSLGSGTGPRARMLRARSFGSSRHCPPTRWPLSSTPRTPAASTAATRATPAPRSWPPSSRWWCRRSASGVRSTSLGRLSIVRPISRRTRRPSGRRTCRATQQ